MIWKKKLDLSENDLSRYLNSYEEYFWSGNRDNNPRCLEYLCGLLHEGKSNIERMAERVSGSDYQQMHHFISESNWDAEAVMSEVARQMDSSLSAPHLRKGLILDESGWRKKGKKSVGVCRQYIGSLGKVENGQVGVFAVLCQGESCGFVGGRLYLPTVWTKDEKRCEKAGIPVDRRLYKTKAELALEIIKNLEDQVDYEWIGGDSIYGNSLELRHQLNEMKKFFVMDTNEDQLVYLSDPQPYIPSPSSEEQNNESDTKRRRRGRPPSSYISDEKPIKIKELIPLIQEEEWQKVTYRKGTKGALRRQVVVRPVYIWSARRSTSSKVEKLHLIISRKLDGSEVKYSFANDFDNPHHRPHHVADLLFMQMQRYWIERSIQDAKDQLGLAQYQVRSWKAWYHHIALTMMALHYITDQRVRLKKEIPLLSCADIKFYFAQTLSRKAQNMEEINKIIFARHKQRKNDIDRYYKNE